MHSAFLQILLEMNEKMEALQREQRLVESALNQVRGQILDQERKRGRPYYEGTPIIQQDSSALVRSIEKCIQELDIDVQVKADRIKEVNIFYSIHIYIFTLYTDLNRFDQCYCLLFF